jgi:hypothetical protein
MIASSNSSAACSADADRCRVCNRRLRSARALAAGIGPVCAARRRAQYDLFDPAHNANVAAPRTRTR